MRIIQLQDEMLSGVVGGFNPGGYHHKAEFRHELHREEKHLRRELRREYRREVRREDRKDHRRKGMGGGAVV